MSVASMHLANYTDSEHLTQTPTRNGFGEGLIEAGRRDPAVVAVCADLAESTRMEGFRNAFPSRFIEIGVQEQLLVAMSAGLAMAGKIPFIASYAMFCP
ncbi:MAG: transketolase family protein, partial [Vulcanimicrobiaceae bacterium]